MTSSPWPLQCPCPRLHFPQPGPHLPHHLAPETLEHVARTLEQSKQWFPRIPVGICFSEAEES